MENCIVCSVSLDTSLASFREVLLFVGNRKMSTVRSRGSSIMKVSRGVGVDHHSRLDITQLFIAQTSVELRCFSLKLFDDSQAGAIYDGIAAAAAAAADTVGRRGVEFATMLIRGDPNGQLMAAGEKKDESRKRTMNS